VSFPRPDDLTASSLPGAMMSLGALLAWVREARHTAHWLPALPKPQRETAALSPLTESNLENPKS